MEDANEREAGENESQLHGGGEARREEMKGAEEEEGKQIWNGKRKACWEIAGCTSNGRRRNQARKKKSFFLKYIVFYFLRIFTQRILSVPWEPLGSEAEF